AVDRQANAFTAREQADGDGADVEKDRKRRRGHKIGGPGTMSQESPGSNKSGKSNQEPTAGAQAAGDYFQGAVSLSSLLAWRAFQCSSSRHWNRWPKQALNIGCPRASRNPGPSCRLRR